jgi:long-chain acyl-CoA synthetase
MDSAIVAAALDRKRLSRTYWAAYSGIALGNPLFRLGSRLAHVVPIDSGRALFSSLAFGAAVLKCGNNLIWFPEGRRSPTGQLTEFKPGMGMLLNRYPVPVVPVHIEGAYEIMPGKFIRRLGQITVTFGELLDPRELEQEGEGEQPHERIVSGLRSHAVQLGQEVREMKRKSAGAAVPARSDGSK